jgi:hypothetical protein
LCETPVERYSLIRLEFCGQGRTRCFTGSSIA